jgi:oligosaccharide repeat unit polymerase
MHALSALRALGIEVLGSALTNAIGDGRRSRWGAVSTPRSVLRPIIIHPLVLYVAPWLLAACLYTLGWSSVLTYDFETAFAVALEIIVPLSISYIFWSLVFWSCSIRRAVPVEMDLKHCARVVRIILYVWGLATIGEIIVSGGLPIIWLIRGQNKTYADFGIPSIHGFLNSMIFAATVMHATLGIVTGRKKYFLTLLFSVVWSLIVISRGDLIIMLMEIGIVLFLLKPINMSKVFIWAGGLSLVLIFLFGVVGDFRSPQFLRDVAGVTPSYPSWLPSGAIWVYLYATTPLNNLVNTMMHVVPTYDWSFSLTTAQLFPSLIRTILVPKSAVNGVLATSAFNVSTAYIGAYQDFGLLGMYVFAWLTMGAVLYFWRRDDPFARLCYAMLGQCAFLSIFFNHFFTLPVIIQAVWFALAARPVATQPLRSLP